VSFPPDRKDWLDKLFDDAVMRQCLTAKRQPADKTPPGMLEFLGSDNQRACPDPTGLVVARNPSNQLSATRIRGLLIFPIVSIVTNFCPSRETSNVGCGKGHSSPGSEKSSAG
jgi:hypothetical protein